MIPLPARHAPLCAVCAAALLVVAPQVRAGTLSASPDPVEFGNVSISAPAATATVTLTNAGTTTSVTGFTPGAGCGEFTASATYLGQPVSGSNPALLGSGDALVVNVTYDPLDRAADTCTFTVVVTGDATTTTFQLTGDGTAPVLQVTPGSLQFADQPWNGGTPQVLNVTIANAGEEPIALANLTLTLSTGTQFALGTITGLPINSGESAMLPVTFDPTSAGAKTDTLTISLNNDAPASPNPAVSLGGNGIQPVGAPRADFDGDGKSDILWRNATSGENYLYPMNGTTILGSEGYLRTVADLNWNIAGIGDFDGDGKADVLWRNSSTGENYLYLMNGTAISGEGYIRTVADQSWQVAGVGDLDGDGKADILWRNSSTGENYLYPMNGLTILGTEGYLRTVASQDWRVAGVGDVNGDGKADILWRNASTGENYVYLMNGTAIAGEGYMRTVADQNWQVVGTGDFNGDGKADLLWRNSSTGENYLYPMNGTTILGTEGYLRTVPDQNWRVQATGDYDGDGKADVLWRNASTGENYLYFMDGTTIKPTEGYIRTVQDQYWTIVASGMPAGPPSSAGTSFLLTFPDHACVSNPEFCVSTPVANRLLITSATGSSGVVTFEGNSTPFAVVAGGQALVDLPASAVLTANETVESKAIRVTATRPVSVHALSESQYSSEGYLALPVARLGKDYLVVTRSSSPQTGSSLAVVAAQDNTTVSITPAAAGATQPAGVEFQVMLNAGQTYQLVNPSTADMTGSRVVSDKPIAVFGAHRCVNVPEGFGFCDYLVEQMTDVARAGTRFHAVPFAGRPGYNLRVVATAAGTVLTYNPAVAGACANLDAGQFCDFVATGAHQILANKPILVAQYMQGSSTGGGWGDPSMVLLVPAERGLQQATFPAYVLAGTGPAGPYANVTIAAAGAGSVRLDGVPVDPGVFSAIGTSGYSSAALLVPAGARMLTADAPFTAIVYQGVFDSSYAYPAAAGMAAP